jgi:NMT1/THI5 like
LPSSAVSMRDQSATWSQRQFVERLALAGAVGLLRLRPEDAAAEPPPETTKIKVHHSLSLCLAPQYVAEDLLRGEGFTEIQYVPHGPKGFYQALGSGEADIAGDFAPSLILQLDSGTPIVVLGGIHVGCFELFGTERVRTIRDLKGKTVGVRGLDTPRTLFFPAWQPTSAWILAGTSPGLRIRRTSRCGFWVAARSTRSSGFLPSLRSSARSESATLWLLRCA